MRQRERESAPRIIATEDHMRKLLVRLVKDESGQDLIEYGLLVGIITVGAILAITSIGPKVQKYYTDLDSNLP